MTGVYYSLFIHVELKIKANTLAKCIDPGLLLLEKKSFGASRKGTT